jgi:membrane-associated phospholipid phosphatase
VDTRVLGFLPYDRPVALIPDWVGEPSGFVTTMAVVGGVCLIFRRSRLAVVGVAAEATVGCSSTMLKPVFGRTIHEFWLSYPSGHTAVATVFALVLGLLFADLAQAGRTVGSLVVLGLALAAGAVAGWAQASLGAHYPTDTVGGFSMALALFTPTALAVDRLADLWHDWRLSVRAS